MGERVRSGRWNGPIPLATGPSCEECKPLHFSFKFFKLEKLADTSLERGYQPVLVVVVFSRSCCFTQEAH